MCALKRDCPFRRLPRAWSGGLAYGGLAPRGWKKRSDWPSRAAGDASPACGGSQSLRQHQHHEALAESRMGRR